MKSKTKKIKLKPNRYTRRQKQKIADKIYNFTDKEVLEDFEKLREIGCLYHKDMSTQGNDVVNKYTAVERLNTVGKHKVNFYDVWSNRNALKNEKFVKNLIKYYHKTNPNYPEIKVWFRISNIYYSAISIFKPLIAMDIYCKYKPTSILDFTMGWGGRVVGACALDIPKYIGVDYNKNLKVPYGHFTKFLKKHSKTEIELHFQDALTVDYSKMNYDMVLTSPPYYNIETYGGNVEKTKEIWDTEFYIPMFERTFKHLKKGGHYCLNIPKDVYKNVALKVLGKPTTKIPLVKSRRFKYEDYHEFIYVWHK
jgi:hypothetical protein